MFWFESHSLGSENRKQYLFYSSGPIRSPKSPWQPDLFFLFFLFVSFFWNRPAKRARPTRPHHPFSSSRQAAEAAARHRPKCRRPTHLPPPALLPRPSTPPETALSIAAGQAPTATASAPLPRPNIKAPLTLSLVTTPCAALCSTPSCLLVPLPPSPHHPSKTSVRIPVSSSCSLNHHGEFPRMGTPACPSSGELQPRRRPWSTMGPQTAVRLWSPELWAQSTGFSCWKRIRDLILFHETYSEAPVLFVNSNLALSFEFYLISNP
jgi:hypothetical protein